MRNVIRPMFFALMAVFFTSVTTSCIQNKFDEPPANGEDPSLTVTTTIAQLKELFSGDPVQITDDVIIAGVIVADDKTGNFYKNLVLQDETGGILMRLDRSDLYVKYPIGRRVFVKCKGLWLGDYNNLIQLGGSLDNSDPADLGVNAIADGLIENYLFPGQFNVSITPEVVSISDLGNAYQNKLIKLENVEFSNVDRGQPYADAINQQSVNRIVTDCDGNEITVRTSGFANFASEITPIKNGTIIGVYSVFGATKQLIIRDYTDVVMEGDRCDGSTGVVTPIDISSIRALYSGTDVDAPVDKKITATVISDKTSGSVDTKNLIIQDATGGIIVRFSAAHSYNVGDVVEINITGGTITEFGGALQLEGIAASAITVTGNTPVTPRTATIAEINANFEAWESTLVSVASVTLSGNSGKYSGSVTATDATGNIILYTRSAASFSGENYPTGTRTLTGIVTPFNTTKELVIRTTADIE